MFVFMYAQVQRALLLEALRTGNPSSEGLDAAALTAKEAQRMWRELRAKLACC